jgi:hypothetical protein
MKFFVFLTFLGVLGAIQGANILLLDALISPSVNLW